MPSHHTSSDPQHRTSARLVALQPEELLVFEAAHSPLMADALNLALWSAPTTPVTPESMPELAMAREAIDDLGLWPREITCEESRTLWLQSLRSVSEAPRLAIPWRAAVHLNMIDASAGQARPSRELEEGFDEPGQIMHWWAGLLSWAVDESDKVLTTVVPEAAGPRLVSRVLHGLYETLDGSRPRLEDLVADGLAGSAHTDALTRQRAQEALLPLLQWLSETGALEVHLPGPEALDDRESGRPCSEHAHLVRLTPLGRFGVRHLLLAEGVPAPLIDDYADVSAEAFLDSLPGFSQEGRLVAVDTWMSARTPAEALRQIGPAVESPGLALRRVHAARALDTVGSELLARLRMLTRTAPDPVAAMAGHVLLASGTLPAEQHEKVLREQGAWAAVDLVAATALEGEAELACVLADPGADVLTLNLSFLIPGFVASGHPAAAAALQALADHHPDRTTADLAHRCVPLPPPRPWQRRRRGPAQ
ncbi:hypothetical protein [Nocardiopsis kunsanensis]|uniref:Uncharacterized protein n=1 Tax=Nocardiopsis kunsanensis TaxID=141693 RepID=A0A918X7Q0_9ACTN|nr:hypothetical protein [Nocardiopsis kunsanensis]GHD17204.1 hypothetical protein GCM10007147_06110 [Nocardiopsis kunsanensis]